MILGAQMYTVREHTKTLDDLAKTLKRIADIGYKTVQVSGTCDFDANWMKAELEKNGLKCVITHNPPDMLLNSTDEVVKNHDVLQCKNVGLGSIPGGLENVEKFDEDSEKFIQTFKPVAKKLYDNGKLFMFHNHDKEFRTLDDGTVILDKFINEFPEEQLGVTFDTYWAAFAGEDPAEWIEKLCGKVECVHLKDLSVVGDEKRMAVVGEGQLDFDKIIDACDKSGTKYLLVEQDDCYGEDPFDCLERSFKFLSAKGFS